MTTQDPTQSYLCLLDESNDTEAFAALPECIACDGTGKDAPADFWAPAAPPLIVYVAGRPAPQGSKRGFVNKTTGKVAMVEMSKRVRPWREDVRQALLEDGRARVHFAGAVRIQLEFVMPRPKGMPKTRATPPHTKQPDVDKLARSTLDAITSAGVLVDDRHVVALHATKRTAELTEQPGCRITIRDAP